jgi:hypothetical protein
MQRLIRLAIIAALLLLSFSSNLLGQRAKLTSTRRVQTARSSKKVSALIRYNESGAVSVLRIIMSAEATYQATAGNGDYGTLKQLGEQVLIDEILAKGHRYGYLFKLRVEKSTAESPASFEAVAVPRKYGRTGLQSFYINETGIMRGANKRGAEATIGDYLLDSG